MNLRVMLIERNERKQNALNAYISILSAKMQNVDTNFVWNRGTLHVVPRFHCARLLEDICAHVRISIAKLCSVGQRRR